VTVSGFVHRVETPGEGVPEADNGNRILFLRHEKPFAINAGYLQATLEKFAMAGNRFNEWAGSVLG
jgi:hypothetical protein